MIPGMATVAHRASPMINLVQRCTRCFAILYDLRNAVWPADSDPPTGWPYDAIVLVDGNFSRTGTAEEVEAWCSTGPRA